jgi:hypothetical protein
MNGRYVSPAEVLMYAFRRNDVMPSMSVRLAPFVSDK